ncbi:MAG: hypothetical protein N4J56_006444 [Chroococcidiopsis sp. SAG 2025]|uniref:hypothetical protein n=1 Tax=Chroococcidiopsis sp. SAG 2025 TaxID=171389 RepID=UPI00293721CB|nr:hypothetical protein [Chroococcidiopsis sp. SAG 2025]MDV2996739.1 hypothetical protein [Chroococcidiopsis sp. SAG 2025]
MPTSPLYNWQNTIRPKLVQRLMRPIAQPGVTGSALADQIRSRAESWSNRLPLLTQISEQHTLSEGSPAGQPPIVYAQPVPAETASDIAVQTSTPSATSSNRPTVIQAKFVPSAPTDRLTWQAVAPAERSLPFDSSVSITTSDRHPIALENPSSQPLPTLPIVAPRSPTSASNTGTLSPQLYTAPADRVPIASAQPVSETPRLIDIDAEIPLVPSHPKAAEPAVENRRSPLLLVRSITPAPKLRQETPLVFAQPTLRSSHPTSSDLTDTTPPKVVRTIAAQNSAATQGAGANSTTAQFTARSIVREAARTTLQPSLQPSLTTQTTISRAEPPPLDVDALADKVERKLARRMAIERERRGWK